MQKLIYPLFLVLLVLDFCMLLWALNTLSISYDEAVGFFHPVKLNDYLANFGVWIFGQNDLGLRIPFVILHLCNAVLLFIFSLKFLKRKGDALLCVAIFMLLPGINASALLSINSGVILFFTLLLCTYQLYFKSIPYWLLAIMAFIDGAFSLIFLALLFYGIGKKNNFLIFISLVLFAFNMYFFGTEIGGHPKSYFLDTNGHLFLIFSPLLYLYFLYGLYRYFNSNNRPLIWYIAFSALIFIFLLSFRQKVEMELYAPFLILALPLLVSLYLSGLRVRLPLFRMHYRIPFIATLLVLLLCNATLIFSKFLFVFIEEGDRHFAYEHFIAKELATSLQKRGIKSLKTDDKELQKRLEFYKISPKNNPILSTQAKKGAKKIEIVYYKKPVASFYVR